MTKKQLFEQIDKKLGGNVGASKFFDAFFWVLTDALKKGEIVSISGFGKFFVKDKPSIKRTNPQTNRIYYTKAKKVCVFKPFKKLKLCVK